MTNTICLDKNYSSTQLATKERPTFRHFLLDTESHQDKSQTILFLPEGEERKGEGGLKTKWYFKKSFEGKALISIITVVFNGEKYLEETIQSVINQTYDNIEYIIIDGGSTDGTLDIIKKYEDKIDYWVSEKDKGIYDAMNKGIDVVSGEWINFMNAGDRFFQQDVLEMVTKELNTDLVYGNHARYLDNPNKYTIVDVQNNNGSRNIPYCHQSVFIKTSILKNNKFDLKYKIAADYNQYLKLKYQNISIKYAPLTISLYLDGGLSAVQRENLINEYFTITKQYNLFRSFLIYIIRKVKFKLTGK